MKRAFALLLAGTFALGCGERSELELRLKGMTPAQGENETDVAVEIAGEHLAARVHTDFARPTESFIDATFRAWLLPVGAELPEVELHDVRLAGPEALTALVPRGIARGFYSVKVVDPFGREAVLPEVYRVVRSARTLAGFRFEPLGPQRAGVPFTVQLTAVDASGALVDGFGGAVSLSDLTGTVSPAQVGPFVLGKARTQVAIATFAPEDKLFADAGVGRSGESNAFAVLPGLAVELAVASATQSVPAGSCSAPVELESRDSFGLPAEVEATIAIGLSAAPPDRFAFFADPACATEVTQVSLPAGESRTRFHFRGERAGAVVVRLLPDVLPTTTQPQTIEPLAPNAVAFITPSQSLKVGQCSPAFSVAAVDGYGNPSAPPATVSIAVTVAPAIAGVFADESCLTATTQAPLDPTTNRASFFLRALAAGTAVVEARPDPSSSLDPATQTLVVSP